MPKLTIDGKIIEVKEGTTVFEAARQSDIPIPHFCYHPKLSIAGNCRMCLVSIEKQSKPAISCNTVAMEGMVVNTKTPEVKALQKNVLEFILINHPIDCPVCDQAGECRLQEYYMNYTMTDSDFDEEKVKKPKKVDLGPLVMLDDERCILCSRCIRFCDEITKTGELCFINRGDQSTLTTFPGKELDNKYSLNTVDICPVGALTSKPFRFKKRVWFLKSVPSICTGCATGCNIFIDHDDGVVWRYKTRDNEAVNQCWTCDEGRMSYPFINEKRLIRPMIRQNGVLQEVAAADALQEIIQGLKKMGGEDTLVLASALESNENNFALKKFAESFDVMDRQYTAREVSQPSSDDFLIKADKNPNRAGVQRLGFKEFSGGTQVKVVIALGALPASAIEKIKQEEPALLVLLTSNEGPALELADVVLPTTTFAEQVGSFTNFQSRVQKFDKALEVKGQAMAPWQWIEKLAEQLELKWESLSPEGLLREGFGFRYEELGKEGKVIK
jgi:NADH-quinone oxidoreductase subunit G